MTIKEIVDKVLYRGGTYHKIFDAYDPEEYKLLEEGMAKDEGALSREFSYRGYTFAKQWDPMFREHFYLVMKRGTSDPNERLLETVWRNGGYTHLR